MFDFDPESLRVVVGPPGTGKTHYVSERVAEAARRYGGGGVMVVSMTKTAAAEAAARVGGTAARLPRDRIGTLHSFAYRALSSPKLAEVDPWATAWNEAHPTLAISDARAEDIEGAPDERAVGLVRGAEYLSSYNLARARLEGVERLSPACREFIGRWERWKRENELLDFQDLIDTAARDTHAAPGFPRIIYGDEAQDWSASEYRLLLTWAAEASGCVIVGDPDQTIYEWRGASEEAVSEVWSSVERKVLAQSYRVPRRVHAYAVEWIRRMVPDRLEADYHAREEEGAVEAIGSSRTNPAGLLEDLRRELERGRSVMILAPCAYMLVEITRALRERGLAFWNPYRPRNGFWNPLGGLKKARSYLAASTRWPEAWTYEELSRWLSVVQATHLVRGTKAWAKRTAERKDFAGELFPVEELATMVQPGTEYWRDGSLAPLQAIALPADRDRLAYPKMVVEDGGPEALTGEPRITVGTIHSAKGGEADTVYLVPEVSTAWGSTMETEKGRRAWGRLLYVGITRARERLVLLQPSGGNSSRLLSP